MISVKGMFKPFRSLVIFSIIFSILLVQLLVLTTYAALNSSDTMNVNLKNLKITSKSSSAVVGGIELVNNSAETYSDIYCVSEVYIKLPGGANLINKVYHPVQLNSNETAHLTINHIFPHKLFQGEYFMTVRLYTRTGISVGLEYAALEIAGDKIGFLTFDPDKCYLLKGGEKLPSESGPTYEPNEQPTLVTGIFNPSDEAVDANFSIKVFERNLTVNSLPVSDTKGYNIKLAPKELKVVELKLPGMTKPESYLASIVLKDQQNNLISGAYNARYVVKGVSGRIINSSVEYSGNNLNYRISIAGPSDESILDNAAVQVAIKDKATGNIIINKEKPVVLGGGISVVDIPLTLSKSDSSNFVVTIKVLNNGNVLDQNETTLEVKNGTLTGIKDNTSARNILNVQMKGSDVLQIVQSPQVYYTKNTANDDDSNTVSINGGQSTVNANAAASNDSTTVSVINLNDILGTPFDKSVQELVKKGIIKGYEDNTFRPYNKITRAEFAAMMCYLLNRDSQQAEFKDKGNFPDVNSKHWGAGFINIALDSGLMKGYPDGKFKPDQNISYAEVITVLVRIANSGKELSSNLVWPDSYLTAGKEMQISNDVSFETRDAAIRGNVAILVNNTLKVKK